MATFRSDIHRKKVRVRGSHYGLKETASATVRLPIGTVLATSDTIKFFIIGGQTVIHRISLLADQDFDPSNTGLLVSLGWLQRLKADAVTPENEGYDQNGTAIRPSPATVAAGFAASGTTIIGVPTGVDTLTEFVTGTVARIYTITSENFVTGGNALASDPDGVGGPYDLALTVGATGGSALAADSYMTCVIEYSGPRALPGSQPDYAYQDRYNSSGVSSV